MKDLNKIARRGFPNHPDRRDWRRMFEPIGRYDPHRSRIIFGEAAGNHNLQPSKYLWSKPD